MSIHISCAAEGPYVAHSAAMLHSVLAHAGDEAVHVHYLHGPSLAADAGRELQGMVEDAGATLSLVPVPTARLESVLPRPERTVAMWYRLLLPELLPGVERVLYLDVDTLVVDSLVPLWNTDLAGHQVAAVTNVLPREHADRPAELGIGEPSRYFNSGVLLLDLKEMRRAGSSQALCDYVHENRDLLLWRDQDALSVVLGDSRLPLHPRWNCMNAVVAFPWSADVFGATAVDEARREPAIRHFEGPANCKPWHYMFQFDGAALYRAHRRETPWPDYRREGATPRNAVRRLARRALRRGRPVSS